MTTSLPSRPFAALLFDMDGTLISSIASAERIWSRWAAAHGLDVATFLPTIHGVRSVETIRRLNLPGIDPEAEAAAITRAEMEDVGDITEIPGARAFLATLPPDRWAIVTSAPRALALRRLAAADMPVPNLMVAAEDVKQGKPAPDCFLLGARRLGVVAEECCVFEDAPAGIRAAEAAGASVVVVTATHHEPASAGHPAIPDYHDLRAVSDAHGIRLTTDM
ncbi:MULTISPECIES: HAD-IA family hydrolase [unclassified Methylobacterium]|jgi:sugar-phosphatase|uniref:HAD-IA family hydrolase n=1 Tax=unclassified Methylobacterium TaxID=2615210 RepID=UPI001355DD4A|nr:HAD-IA family hydrolase [Methylobacterium sp. 2A]MWV22312.1 HAD-IA family hydrolase [Methylobacterium sp. 2A]